MGGAAARDRPGRVAQRLSPPRGLSARKCGYAGIFAGRATTVGPDGGYAPSQVDVGGARGARASLGPQRDVPHRVAAPGGVAAQRAKPRGATADRVEGDPTLVGSGIPGAVAEGPSA